ncbi:uncharacterized protein LOC134528992 [Bacillus rossius redtenbacheri]|uniref:uncharacterized protein LOC134528992 n=1 Tax=Bacillus rossius redtenbacheri TaxID=93214 RepID=UPI002FDD2440
MLPTSWKFASPWKPCWGVGGKRQHRAEYCKTCGNRSLVKSGRAHRADVLSTTTGRRVTSCLLDSSSSRRGRQAGDIVLGLVIVESGTNILIFVSGDEQILWNWRGARGRPGYFYPPPLPRRAVVGEAGRGGAKWGEALIGRVCRSPALPPPPPPTPPPLPPPPPPTPSPPPQCSRRTMPLACATLLGACLPLLLLAACLPMLLLAYPWPVTEKSVPSLLTAAAAAATAAANDSAEQAAGLNASRAMEEAVARAVSKASRDRIREDRIHAIKYQILGFLGFMGGEPTINDSDKEQLESVREWYNQMSDMPEWPPSEMYTERVQSFYPSCDLPKNTDAEMWNDPTFMHMYFDLKYPEPSDGMQSDIITAKLHLHKKSKGTKPWHDEMCKNVSTPSSEETEEGVTSPTHNDSDGIVRVSVYHYTRSLKRNRVKKKILDTRVLPVCGEEWTEFNVSPAAKSWKETGRNHGLGVQVEDEQGHFFPARDHFSPMDCTDQASATARPIPGFLVATGSVMQRNRQISRTDDDPAGSSAAVRDKAFYFNKYMFPMIDLCTIDVPKQDAMETALKHLDDDFASTSSSPFDDTSPRASTEIPDETTDSGDGRDGEASHSPGHRHHRQHRHRHHHRRHQPVAQHLGEDAIFRRATGADDAAQNGGEPEDEAEDRLEGNAAPEYSDKFTGDGVKTVDVSADDGQITSTAVIY